MNILKRTLVFFVILFLAASSFAKKKKQDVDIYEIVKTGTLQEIKKSMKSSFIGKKYGEGERSLLMAALEGSRDIEIIKYLLKSGEAPESVDINGDSVIIWAVKYKVNEEILKELIVYGTKLPFQRRGRILMENNQGMTAFDFAVENSVQMDLLKKYGGSRIESKLKTIGVFSQETEDPNQEKKLDIEYVVNNEEPEEDISDDEVDDADETDDLDDLDESDDLEEPPKQIDENLLSSKAAAEEAIKNRGNPNKRTYLFDGIVPFETYDDSVKPVPLIKNPDKKDKNGRTMLHAAAQSDDVEKIELLLKSGADVNLTDGDSWTALMYAARFAKKRETVAALVKGGADLGAKNAYGSGLLDIAAFYNASAEVVDEIAKHSSKKDLKKAFFAAVGLGRPGEIIEIFFNYGISPNMVYKGKTPLMYAAESNTDTDCIKFLLEHGADKTFITSDYKDAYYYASKNPNLPHNEVYWSLNNSPEKN